MGNPFGRSTIVPLTNKSGGSVAAGDFVIIDTANNDAFTTGTTAGYTKGIGIAQQTIASNAIGLVLIDGYAALVNVNASVTRGNFLKSHTVVKQGTDAGASRAAGTCGMFLTGGTTPDALIWQPDLGSGSGEVVTTAAIWDAAGDLAVGTGADTAARLAIGAAGGALSRVNGAVAWNSGTSFPSAATGDRYWRTDLGEQYYYDGTRWLSVTLHKMNLAFFDNISATKVYDTPLAALQADGDIWLVAHYVSIFSSSLSGTAYWRVGLQAFDDATGGSTIGEVNDQSGTNSVYLRKKATIGALLAASSDGFTVYAIKVSTPGIMQGGSMVTYRTVAT